MNNDPVEMLKTPLPAGWEKPGGEQQKKERPPIQPHFSWRPWGQQAVLVPSLAFSAAVLICVLTGSGFPSWPAALLFYLILGAGNGILLARAIGETARQKNIAVIGAIAGLVGTGIFYNVRLALFYAVFLLVFVAVRSTLRFGSLVLLFFGCVAVTGLIFSLTVRYAYGIPLYLLFFKDDFALTMTVCYPFACSVCTASMSLEVTPKGVTDAAFAGVRGALLSMFWGYASFLLFKHVQSILYGLLDWPETNAIHVTAAFGGIVVMNYVFVRHLLNMAKLARAEESEASSKTIKAGSEAGHSEA